MRSTLAALLMALLMAPTAASAASVFGGKVSISLPCVFNGAIWDTVGAPRGGLYIWTGATRTYPYGLPTGGKWVLGLYGIPYFCLFSIAPLIVFPGITMTMVGSSQ